MDKKKTVLLFCPHLLNAHGGLWQLLHISKEKNLPVYQPEAISASSVSKQFPKLPQHFASCLMRFSEKQLETAAQEILATVQKMSGEGKEGAAFRQAFERKLHQDFSALKPFLSLAPCYHQVPVSTDKKRFRTAPCKFSPYTPGLRFQVRKAPEGYLFPEVEIDINGAVFPYNLFVQSGFLLEHGNEYFILRFTDYRTLAWIADQDWKREGADPNAFAENILSRLEADYPVHRNDHFHINVVQTAPEGQVVLSELSGQFLMLTPRFDYDGFVAEGPYREKEVQTRDGKEYTIVRSKDQEDEIVAQLLSLHPQFENQRNGYYYLPFAEAQKKNWFLQAFRKLLNWNMRVLGLDMLKHFRYCPEKPQTTLAVTGETRDQLHIAFTLHFGKEPVQFTDLQKAIRSGQSAIPLKDGSIALLDEEWKNRYGIIVKHARIDEDKLWIPRWVAVALQQQDEGADVLPAVLQQDWWARWKQWQRPDQAVYPVPAAVQATLRQYQQKGYEWMRLMDELGAGILLADDMGLGKTLQTICFVSHVLEKNPNGKILVVCPASLMYNWQHELNRFAPGFGTCIYHGPGRKKEILSDEQTQIIISSYGTLRTDEALFTGLYFELVVLDESHTIKNPDAQISKIVHGLGAERRMMLSGTPVMNNTLDLYSQLQFILPGMFGSQQFFKRQYADPIDVYKDEQRIKDLHRLTAPFILRRTKEQVATDLPPKSEIILWCRMTEAQQAIYEEVKNNIRENIKTSIRQSGMEQSKLQILNGILKLRQICNAPALLKDASYSCDESAKLEELLNEIENNLSKHKALVFSQFTSMLDIISDGLRKKKIAHLLLTGSTAAKERDRLVQEFNDPASESRVFLLSLKAGNAGLNLTAADYVFLFDPWWNSAIEQQAIDRSHRIGQTKAVFAYKLICKDSIEERIIRLQQDKKHLAGELIREEDGFVKGLTEQDIEFLFQ